jgi:transcriptional regulator with XRE-family HTH domain
MGLSLKQWRLAKEISQEEMATRCGVHRNTYASWEENPDNISVGNAKIISNALCESVNTIFFTQESTKCRTEE